MAGNVPSRLISSSCAARLAARWASAGPWWWVETQHVKAALSAMVASLPDLLKIAR